jgi:hypothetical protein
MGDDALEPAVRHFGFPESFGLIHTLPAVLLLRGGDRLGLTFNLDQFYPARPAEANVEIGRYLTRAAAVGSVIVSVVVPAEPISYWLCGRPWT